MLGGLQMQDLMEGMAGMGEDMDMFRQFGLQAGPPRPRLMQLPNQRRSPSAMCSYTYVYGYGYARILVCAHTCIQYAYKYMHVWKSCALHIPFNVHD